MNLRHAAALALVGWYLMVPPMVQKEDWQLGVRHSTAPLSEWFIWNSFDTADACTKARDALRARPLSNALTDDYHRWLAGRASSINLLEEWENIYSDLLAINNAFSQAQCIATDDPRLNSN